MTLSRGWHGATGGLRRAVAGGCVAAGIVAGLWAGPAAFASSSVPQSGSSASSAPTKYYIVPVPPKGGTESLYDIALQTLGSGARYLEIFNLNKGRLQPNGARMESPRTIDAGWILQLPADARGPGGTATDDGLGRRPRRPRRPRRRPRRRRTGRGRRPPPPRMAVR